MQIYISLIIICIILLFIKYLYHPYSLEQLCIDDMINNDLFETGDIILFNSQFNYSSLFVMNHITHVGIIFKNNDGTFIFEVTNNKIHDDINISTRNYILMTPIYKRLANYPGNIYYKKLNKKLTKKMYDTMKEFIEICYKTKYYDINFFDYVFSKKILGEKFRNNINCVELIMELLYLLDLHDYEIYRKKICNPLKYIENLSTLKHDYEYLPMIKLEKQFY